MAVTPPGVLALTIVLACALSPLLPARTPLTQQAVPARIEKLFLIDSSRGPIRSVAFSFDFPGRDAVSIKGLGTVPARGSFRYLTLEGKLEFFEPGTGRRLFELPLKDPEQLMGRYSVTLPAQTDFPQAFRSGQWARKESFQVHLVEVLNRHFPSGYLVLQIGEANAVLTTYRTVDGLSEPLFGRVAVIVEVTDQSPASTFRMRFSSQERRSRTDWQDLNSQEVRTAVEKYITSLVRELEGRAQ